GAGACSRPGARRIPSCRPSRRWPGAARWRSSATPTECRRRSTPPRRRRSSTPSAAWSSRSSRTRPASPRAPPAAAPPRPRPGRVRSSSCWSMSWRAAGVLMLLVACGDPRPARRDEARAVLAKHCGSCHERHRDTAFPAALAVYDLDEREWAARMSDVQLDSALWRLREPLPPDGRPSGASPPERARFAAYVDAEKAARYAAPACPPDDVLEALPAAAYHLERGGLADDVRVRAPLDAKPRDLLARLARATAGVADRVATTEEIRAELSSWRCLDAAKHARFHDKLQE